MYLAGILGLCALLCVPVWARVSSESSSFPAENQPALIQQSNQQEKAEQPATQAPQKDQSKPDTSQPTPQESQPSQNAPGPQTANPPAANSGPNAPPSPSTQEGDEVTPAKHATKKKHSPHASGQEPQKRVVRRGSTTEPTTKLAPSITTEQAARQRETTNKLLASTDASLQKLSGRQLTKDEQETVAQIRKFMEQVKTADAAGDLQRAYKLAMKAHLLSDALSKE